MQGHRATPGDSDLLAMARPFWNIEFVPPRQDVADNETEDRCNVECQAQYLLTTPSLAEEQIAHSR